MTTLLEKFQARSLPIISADDITGQYVLPSGIGLDASQKLLVYEAMTEYFNPTEWEIILDTNLNLQLLKDNYVTAVARLQQIQNASTLPFTTTGFNQAQLAIKDEALILERLLKLQKIIILQTELGLFVESTLNKR